MHTDKSWSTRTDPAETAATPSIYSGLDGLFPILIIAFGSPAQPVERLMGLQSTVAKAVGLLATVHRFRPRLRPPGWLHFRTP